MKKAEQNEFKLVVPGEKEKQRWDKLVMQDPAGNIYSLSWYLDVVTPGKWGIVTNEKMTAGLPIAFKKRTGYRNIYQPFYTMFFNALGKIKLETLLETVANDFHHIHITTESETGKLKHNLRQRQELLLKNSSTKTYSENASRQIKKAEKNGLDFSFHNDASEVTRIFRQNKGAELKEYKAGDFKTLQALIEKSLEKKQGFCARVTEGNTVLASAFFLVFRNRIIFLKGGVSEAGKTKGAMYFLIHQVMEWSRDKYEVFDFGGSNNKNVGDFYRKLGGKDVAYYEVKIDRRNVIHKVIGKLRK